MSELPQTATLFSVSYVGDLVTATSTLDMIARRCAGGVEVVAAPAGAPLVASDPAVAAVRVVASTHAVLWRAQVARALLDARRRRAQIVNLEVFPPRWRFVDALARALRLARTGLDLPALLADNERSARREATTVAHRTTYYARAAGIEADAPTLRLHVRTAERDATRQRLAALGIGTERPWIVVHPGSNDPRRRPSADFVAALLGHLAGDGAAGVLVVGVPSEASLTAAVVQRAPPGVHVADGCGIFDVRGLAATLSGAALFVGGDSGPLKIAEAVGVPTLSFWTPGAPAPEFAGPRGPGHVMLPVACPLAQAGAAGRSLIDHLRSRG